MKKEEYKKLVTELSPKEHRIRNVIVAFLVGGLIGFFGEVIIYMLMTSFGLSRTESYIWLCLGIIFIATLATALSFFDNWVSKCKCGLIIPTTGFAHSVASCALDYRKDGLITGLGSNFFKLAGSVILYGVVSSFLLAIVSVIING